MKKRSKKPRRVLVFPLGWDRIAWLFKEAKVAARHKALAGWVYRAEFEKFDTMYDRHPETPLRKAEDAAIHELLDSFVDGAQFMSYLMRNDRTAEVIHGFHAQLSVDDVKASFAGDGFEVIDCVTAPSVFGGEQIVGVDVRKKLANVSANLLWKKAVPRELEVLWHGQANGDGVIHRHECGEVTLFDKLPTDIERELQPIEGLDIAWIGREADGGVLGFWRYDRKAKVADWPVVHLDREGDLTQPAQSLQELFETRDRTTRRWFKERGLTRPAKRTLPSFDKLLNA